METTGRPGLRCYILTMPTELRLRIYEALFTPCDGRSIQLIPSWDMQNHKEHIRLGGFLDPAVAQPCERTATEEAFASRSHTALAAELG